MNELTKLKNRITLPW